MKWTDRASLQDSSIAGILVSVQQGPIAQLVERYTGSVEVSGSTPLGSTSVSHCDSHSAFSPGDSCDSHSAFSPGDSCDSHSAFSPGDSCVSHSAFLPGLSCDSHSAFLPGLSCDSHSAFLPSDIAPFP
jgi:hypothetical protein